MPLSLERLVGSFSHTNHLVFVPALHASMNRISTCISDYLFHQSKNKSSKKVGLSNNSAIRLFNRACNTQQDYVLIFRFYVLSLHSLYRYGDAKILRTSFLCDRDR